jgi:hypothetical protein
MFVHLHGTTCLSIDGFSCTWPNSVLIKIDKNIDTFHEDQRTYMSLISMMRTNSVCEMHAEAKETVARKRTVTE